MLCQNCWSEEARVHFTVVGPHEAHERAYCLACAQEQSLSWLLVWGYGVHPLGTPPAPPEVLPVSASQSGMSRTTLVGTGVARCECGCCIVVGAELPCGHRDAGVKGAAAATISHTCHCGREVQIPVPVIFCPKCGSPQRQAIIASVETCLWDEQRRRIVGVDLDLRGGRATWGTFATMN
ncbi:MAG: hypothetical protein FJ291_09285 [Planctomycetes bacterium]|nr:hypothetical protein [Planctomycetota bacterium]